MRNTSEYFTIFIDIKGPWDFTSYTVKFSANPAPLYRSYGVSTSVQYFGNLGDLPGFSWAAPKRM